MLFWWHRHDGAQGTQPAGCCGTAATCTPPMCSCVPWRTVACCAVQDTVSIILFNVMPQLIDILVACTYLASALKGPWVALIVLFTVGSYVPLTLLITEQRGKVRSRHIHA